MCGELLLHCLKREGEGLPLSRPPGGAISKDAVTVQMLPTTENGTITWGTACASENDLVKSALLFTKKSFKVAVGNPYKNNFVTFAKIVTMS